MSTKTLRKRIALVAVSALGAGVLSIVAVPAANAAVTAAPFQVAANGGTTTTSQGILAGSTGANLSGTSNTMTMLSTGTLYVTVSQTGGSASTDMTKIAVSGGLIGTCSAGTLAATQTSCTSTTATAIGNVTIKPAAVGTPLVITSSYSTDTGTTYTTDVVLVVSVVASTTVNVLSVGDSYFRVVNGAGSTASTNVDATWAATSAGSAAAASSTRVRNSYAGYFAYNLKDSNGSALSAPAVVATSTGGCVISAGADSKGTQASAYSSSAASYFRVDRPTSNVPATCTVTITVNGTTASTRTFTFEGQLAKIVLTASGIVKASSTASNSEVFFVDALDSAGNSLDNVAISADSSYYNAALTTVSMSNTAPWGAYATDNAITTITCLAKGSYKMRLKGTATDTSTIKSDEFTIKCAGSPVNYTAALDKSSYVPGDVATLTITAKDSAGNATYDAATVGTGVSIAGSNMTAVSAPTDTDTFTDGVKKYKFIVGSTEGSYQLSVDLPAINNTTYNQAALTVPYTIKASSASVSNAEVLAAIVKLIASINKQIAALQKALTKKK